MFSTVGLRPGDHCGDDSMRSWKVSGLCLLFATATVLAFGPGASAQCTGRTSYATGNYSYYPRSCGTRACGGCRIITAPSSGSPKEPAVAMLENPLVLVRNCDGTYVLVDLEAES